MYVPLYVYMAEQWKKLLVLSDIRWQEFSSRLSMETSLWLGIFWNRLEGDSLVPVLITYKYIKNGAPVSGAPSFLPNQKIICAISTMIGRVTSVR